ncbi:hypothetical protein P43SY_009687 [Pythium insidiosum]|uniref:Transmembrane protein n=1 Tax=Pythium insidiosum TaxID=114742 RepID=A0AAD5Q5N4_PYTIN|nr:hypothetical protein P43SY_009687 [Pythium insidiosum]
MSSGAHARRPLNFRHLLHRHRSMRSGDIDRDEAFSWRRCVLSLVSYTLLFTDVLRTGLAIDDLKYNAVEPDTVVFLGPSAYSVADLQREDRASGDRLPLWLYKYDSTSIAMRAIAKRLGVSTWPPCVQYDGQCDKDGIPAHTVFAMLDSLLDRVKQHLRAQPRRASSRGSLSLRLEHNWIDRLNHLVLPQFFRKTIKRSVQAIHYGAEDLTKPLCGPGHPRPLGCHDHWVNFKRICSSHDAFCRDITSVWDHTAERTRSMQRQFPNATLELLIIEASEDYSRGGLMFHGHKMFEVVAMTRARSCSSVGCETIAVSDFRYEGGVLTTSALHWYNVIAAIRAAGQVYTWIRVISLIVGLYVARTSEIRLGGRSFGARCRATIRTFFLVPSHVIIYGSVFPICCYFLAHLMDSSTVYDYVAQHFSSVLGQYHFDVRRLVAISAVSMRSVWVLAFVCHLLLHVYSHRLWSHESQVVGTPKFLIGIVCSVTVFAQVRALGWRDSRVLQVQDVVASGRQHHVRVLAHDSFRGSLNQLLLGNAIDVQFVMASLLALGTLSFVLRVSNRISPRHGLIQLRLVGHTPVPFSTGSLWPTHALMVSWNTSMIMRHRSREPSAKQSFLEKAVRLVQARCARTRAFPTFDRMRVSVRRETSSFTHANSSRILSEFVALDSRQSSVESNIYLLNLAAMTDPFTFLRLRLGDGQLIGIFESKVSQRYFLLPLAVVTSVMDVPVDWDDFVLLMIVSSRELSWLDLLQCG